MLLRVATSIPLLYSGLQTPVPGIADLVMAGVAALLLVGLWTPIAGGLIAAIEVWRAWSHPTDPWIFLHFGVLSAALAMLGPGACSVDARLFGRKHIQIPER